MPPYFRYYNYNQWQKSRDALFFPYMAVLVSASPSPPPIQCRVLSISTMFQHDCLGGRGFVKLKSKGPRHGILFYSASQVLLPLIVGLHQGYPGNTNSHNERNIIIYNDFTVLFSSG